MERTVFVALVYRGPYGATVEHTQAHVVPLLLTWVLDVVINLSMQRLRTRYAAVTVLERVAFLHVWHCPIITGDKLSCYVSLVSPCPPLHPRPLKLLQLRGKEISPDFQKGTGRGSGYGVWQKGHGRQTKKRPELFMCSMNKWRNEEMKGPIWNKIYSCFLTIMCL